MRTAQPGPTFASSSPRFPGVPAASVVETEDCKRFLSLPLSQNPAGTFLAGFVFPPGTFLGPPGARSRRTLLAALLKTSLPVARGATDAFRTQARHCCRHFEGRASALVPGWGLWA